MGLISATPSLATSARTAAMQLSSGASMGRPAAVHTSTGMNVGAGRVVTKPDRTSHTARGVTARTEVDKTGLESENL